MTALRDVDLIVHAGDIGEASILEQLEALAPTIAVRGNVDRSARLAALPQTEVATVAGKDLYILHDLDELDLDPGAAGFAAVISGHSHMPALEVRRGVLYLNPGSVGPRRFKLPVAMARIEISAGRLNADRLYLDV